MKLEMSKLSENNENTPLTKRRKLTDFPQTPRTRAEIQFSTPRIDRYFPAIPSPSKRQSSPRTPLTRCYSTNVTEEIVRGSSLIKRTKSLSKYYVSPPRILQHEITQVETIINKKKLLKCDDLKLAMENVARKMAANNHHDVNGVRILALNFPEVLECPEMLPFRYYTFFDAYTR